MRRYFQIPAPIHATDRNSIVFHRLDQTEFPSEPVTNSVVVVNILSQFYIFVFIALYVRAGVLTETNCHVASLMTHLCYQM